MANRSAARRCDPAGRRLRGVLCGGAVMESEEKENRQGGPCGLLCLLCCLPLFSLPSGGGVVQRGRRWRRSAPRFHVSRNAAGGTFHGATGRYFSPLPKGSDSTPNGISPHR